MSTPLTSVRPRFAAFALAIGLLATGCLEPTLAPSTAPLEPRKVHAEAMAEHAGVVPATTGERPLVLHRAVNRRLTRKVYGYYPYWGSGWRNLRFDLLTTLAYFASPINENGEITGSNGWGGAAVNELVAAAKRAGVKVVQTITLFDNAAIGRLLASAERRERAITNIIAEVQRGGGEGVNIDFEFVPLSAKATFVTFMRDLTTRMHAAIPNSEVTLAAPSIDWSGSYDYDQLAIHTDGLMIMAYGYHWSGGSPGPLCPIRSDAPWTGRSLTWTMDDYDRNGGVANRAKFIVGLPFYGNDWPTTSDRVPGTSAGRARSIFYKAAVVAAARHGRRWDTASGGTPYYLYREDGGHRQVWYDDDESLGLRIDAVVARDFGGIGIWALSYDGDRPELFDTIERKLTEVIDGGVADGGARDAGVVLAADAGLSPDAGAERDAGVAADAGTTRDGGLASDAGALADAGSPSDAGAVPPDAGALSTTDAGTTVAPPAGGCSTGDGPTSLSAALLALLALLRRRR